MRSSILCLLLIAAASTASAQDAVATNTEAPAAAAAAPAPVALQPLQSPAAETAAPLVTTADTAALASAVAGTCSVIDAMMLEICAQSPNDDYCRQ